MALVTCSFFSEALEVGTSMTVLLPQATSAQIGVDSEATSGPPPVLYLLHGLSDDHTAWTRYTAVERYTSERGLAVVMPAAGRSFYTDEAQGHRYWTFVSEELPRVVAEFFRVSPAPEDTFVAGLSMGGYGALRLALTQPERYAAAASLSGGIDIRRLLAQPGREDIRDRVFGGRVRSENDLFELVARAGARGAVPPLHLSCGTDDVLFDSCRRFAKAAEAAGAEVTSQWPSGGHEWRVWDQVIEHVVAWLPLRDPAASPSVNS